MVQFENRPVTWARFKLTPHSAPDCESGARLWLLVELLSDYCNKLPKQIVAIIKPKIIDRPKKPDMVTTSQQTTAAISETP